MSYNDSTTTASIRKTVVGALCKEKAHFDELDQLDDHIPEERMPSLVTEFSSYG